MWTRASRSPRLSGVAVLGCAAPAGAQQDAVARAGAQLHAHALAVGCGHVDLGAGGGLGEAHRDVDDEVVAAPREHGRGLDRDLHEEIARRRAVRAGLALAAQSDARAVLDAGRDRHRVAAQALRGAAPAAVEARVLDHVPGAAAAQARLREREESLCLRAHAATVAVRAGRRAGARGRAGAVADGAGRQRLDADRDARAVEAVAERDRHARLEVVAALGRRRTAAAPAAAPEDAAEQVGEVDAVLVEGARVEPAAGCGTAHAGLAQEVVLLALLRIGEDLVGLRDLLEALLGSRIVRVLVGVRLAHELAIGLLDLVGARVAGDAERLVMVRHQDSPTPKVPHDHRD